MWEADLGRRQWDALSPAPAPQGTLQQFVDNFFQSVLAPGHAVPPAVKYFFDFLDEQAEKHDIKDEDTIHIWKTNRCGLRASPAPPALPQASAAPHTLSSRLSLPLRFWVNILKNPHFIFDVHVHEVVDASLSVIAQTFMDACTRTEHKLSRVSAAAGGPARFLAARSIRGGGCGAGEEVALGRGFAQRGLELSRKTGAGHLGQREAPWAVDLWQPGTPSPFPSVREKK